MRSNCSATPEDAGAVFVIEVPTEEFIGTLEGTGAALDANQSRTRS
ncbi:hypothetical protein [Streptomyces sp. NPDC005283]